MYNVGNVAGGASRHPEEIRGGDHAGETMSASPNQMTGKKVKKWKQRTDTNSPY